MSVIRKQKGFALLGIVAVVFIVLALTSAILFTVAAQTKKTEVWEMKYERQRLSLLARSAIYMTAEAFANVDDKELDEKLRQSLSTGEIKTYRPGTTNPDGDMNDSLELTVSGNYGNLVRIKATANTSDGTTKVALSGIYDKDRKKIVRWVTDND
ncbi:MAG: type II secretion system protein [Synergistaceae bacterium]|nr:type II secretion system protein [Synergistaceae bacterium]